DQHTIRARASDASMTVEASRVRESRHVELTASDVPSALTFEYERRAPSYCGNLTQDRTHSPDPCVDGAADAPVLRTCADGTQALAPLFRRALDAATGE